MLVTLKVEYRLSRWFGGRDGGWGGGWVVGVGGAYTASQITLLYMKRLNNTESPIVFLCVICVSKGNLLDFHFMFSKFYKY